MSLSRSPETLREQPDFRIDRGTALTRAAPCSSGPVVSFRYLAPYAYGHGTHPGVVHVGWLDGAHPFAKGPVDRRLVEKLKLLAAEPVELYRGRHICEVCIEPADIIKRFVPDRGRLIDPDCSWAQWADQRWGNGEIRVSGEGVTFAASVLIVHYIEEHGYLPPTQFLKAVEEAS